MDDVFTIDACAYAVVSNHYPLVVWLDTRCQLVMMVCRSICDVKAQGNPMMPGSFDLTLTLVRQLLNRVKTHAAAQFSAIAMWLSRAMTRYLFLIAIVLASGCSKDVVDNVATAWSDDSERIAFLERSYTKMYNVSDYSTKNIEYRIGTISRNGESRQYRTSQFNGGDSDNLSREKELYYKSKAGYFLVRVGNSGTSVRDDGIFTDKYEYYLYDLSGNVTNAISKTPKQYCKTFNTYIPSIRVLPSPSGVLIAKVETTDDCELEIRILDYNNNLTAIYSKRIDGLAVAGLFWVNESNLLINSCLWIGCTEGWVLLRVGAEKAIPIGAELFSTLCLAGAVVSSSVNTSGDKVDNNLAIAKIENYSGTELNRLAIGPTRSPDNPANCVNIENI